VSSRTSKLKYTAFGAAIASTVFLMQEFVTSYFGGENSEQFIVLSEPVDPDRVYSAERGIGIWPSPDETIKKWREDWKFRRQAVRGKIDFFDRGTSYIGTLAHECGVSVQLLNEGLHGHLTLFLPLDLLSDKNLICLVDRAGKERIEVGFVTHQSGDWPFGVSAELLSSLEDGEL
jgi:hypothetical protein